jgi:hypothetical protein
MTTSKLTLLAATAGLACICGAGCSVSMKYGTSGVDRLVRERQRARLVVPEILDARVDGKPGAGGIVYGQDREEDFQGLREAVGEHVQRAGLVPEGTAAPRAPHSEQEVARILDRARASGAQAVLFLRLEGASARGDPAHWAIGLSNASLPLMALGVGIPVWIIADSLPVHGEYADATVEGLLVDPSTRELLGRFSGKGHLANDSVTRWGYAPLAEIPGVIRTAVQQVLAAAVQAQHTGYPRRQARPDLLRLVLQGEQEQPKDKDKDKNKDKNKNKDKDKPTNVAARR